MERRIRLGELLIRAGLISELQLNAALAEQRKWGGRLGRILVDMSFVSEDILVKGLSRLLNVARADFTDINVPEAILERFDAADCLQRGYLPLRYSASDKRLTLAMVDVQNVTLVDELGFKYGLTLVPVIAGERALHEAGRALFYGAGFDGNASSRESSIKFLNNQGSTLIKSRLDYGKETQHMARSRAVGRSDLAAATTSVPSTKASSASTPFAELEAAQRRQSIAIKSVLELLIDKGVFTRDEFLACVNRQTE